VRADDAVPAATYLRGDSQSMGRNPTGLDVSPRMMHARRSARLPVLALLVVLTTVACVLAAPRTNGAGDDGACATPSGCVPAPATTTQSSAAEELARRVDLRCDRLRGTRFPVVFGQH